MKKFVICVIAVLSVVCCGCAAQEEKEEVEEYILNNNITVYVDPETGVNYLIFEGYYRGGITVRYNADGTIMVTNFTESEE